MRVVLQRVARACVRVDGTVTGQIDRGWLALVGAERGDTAREADWLAGKTAGLRAFEDAGGRMNLSVRETGGGVLVVSQFTIVADCAKGRRPSFVPAAPPEEAEPLCERFASRLEELGLAVARGRFGARMEVELVNDGPVTFVLDRRAPS